MRWLGALLLWLAAAAPAWAEDQGRFVEHAAAPSANVPLPHVVVWLPPGYDRGTGRYPVVYMHDGQNLFFPERSGFNKVWAADKAALQLIAAGTVAPFIIVGIDHPGKARYRQYFPVKVPRAEFRGQIERSEGPLTGDAYVRFMADELKPFIDRTYRTRPGAKDTAVAGSSMGGLISLYLLAERPDRFGKAAAVSTHLALVGPDTLKTMPGMERAVVADWRRYLSATLRGPRGRKLWMDHGTETLDAGYAPFQQPVDAAIRRLGWRPGKDFETRVFQGAAHEENAWAARLPEIWGWLLSDWRR